MDLDEIKEFTHPIRKLNIYNTNRYSLRKRIVLKVNPQPKEDETVRFSLNRDSDFIGHQQKGNDFYIRVPNNYLGSGSDTNVADNGNVSITTIFVHYFPKDLYKYEDDVQVFSEFDLYKIANIDQEQESYRIHFKNYETNEEISNEQMKTKIQEIDDATTSEEKERLETQAKKYKPIIQSLFLDRTTKDPNYKNYDTGLLSTDNNTGPYVYGIDGNVTASPYVNYITSPDMTEKGEFPLSSRYRGNYGNYYFLHPQLKDSNPKWIGNEGGPGAYWEVEIHRDDLSPLISDGVENTDEDTPLNVFLNYNYLQTSTNYHQHLFGFQSQLQSIHTDYNILEGENLNTLDKAFGSDNNYRVIELGMPYDDRYSIKVPKGNQIPLNLDEILSNNWRKNTCENYYICSGNATLSFTNIKKNSLYSLKYYIYIPGKCNTKYNSCYISVNNEKISNNFLYQDKKLKNEWIYHEVPFIGEEENTINIIGSDDHSNIYFYDIYIEEMVEYSPTIKYSNRGIAVVEEDQAIMRSFGAKEHPSVRLENTTWKKKNKNLPTPYHSIFFLIGQEEMMSFDSYTYNFYYFGNRLSIENDDGKPLSFIYANNYDIFIEDTDIDDDVSEIETKNFTLEYNENNGELTIDMKNALEFIQGRNNYFEVFMFNENEAAVTTGHIKCSIYDTENFQNIPCDNISTPRGVCLDPGESYHEPNAKGFAIYDRVNLSDLALNENDEDKIYYLKIVYENECNNDEKIIDIKPFILKKEEYIITPMTRGNTINNLYNFNNDNLPLQIQAKITNQANRIVDIGYCEIFIDDELRQSTIVDNDGIADFYLDLEDIKVNTKQTVKILYYKKWNIVAGQKIFTINNTCSLLPAIPIKVQALSYKINNVNTTLGYENEYRYTNTITIKKDSPVFIDIDVDTHHQFKLEIEAPNSQDNASVIVDTQIDKSYIYCNHLSTGIQHDETYYIITKSIDNSKPKYRETRIPIYFKTVN